MEKLIYKKAKKEYLSSDVELNRHHFDFKLPGATYYDALLAYKMLVEEVNDDKILCLESILTLEGSDDLIDCAEVIPLERFKCALNNEIEPELTIGEAINEIGERLPVYRLYDAEFNEEGDKLWIVSGHIAEEFII